MFELFVIKSTSFCYIILHKMIKIKKVRILQPKSKKDPKKDNKKVVYKMKTVHSMPLFPTIGIPNIETYINPEQPKSQKILNRERLLKLYDQDRTTLKKINQMKNNNGVVYQKNFSVENYQFQLVILFY